MLRHEQESLPQPLPEMIAENDASAPPAPASAETASDRPPVWTLKLLRSRRTKPLFRKILENPADPEWQTHAAFTALLDTLRRYGDEGWRERGLASWALGKMPLTPVNENWAVKVLNSVADNSFNSRTERIGSYLSGAAVRTLMVGTLLGTGLALVFEVVGACERGVAADPDTTIRFLLGAVFSSIFASLLLAPFGLPISTLVDLRRNNAVRINAVEALARIGNPLSVCSLAKAASTSNARLGSAARSALMRILPRLRASHFGALDIETTPALCGALLLSEPAPEHEDREFQLAVLRALELVGDGRSISTVELVLDRTSDAAVRRLADAVLPVLVERHRQVKDSGTLLRGASEPNPDAGHLLRAASETGVADTPDQLLHSSSTPIEAQSGQVPSMESTL